MAVGMVTVTTSAPSPFLASSSLNKECWLINLIHMAVENEHYSRKHQPSPESSERDSFSEEFEHRIPSNKAHPTLSDEYQHSGADPQHPKRPSKEELSPEERKKQDKAEEDVKKHNEDMKKRYDRAYVQLGNHSEFRSLEEEVEEFRNRVN
ncbi:conserved hypothetical protein [Histoplasma capsulatum H143]|uniref:Uncharacterized protein n=1 Tax=Ajellomyces capsulatus (strain H143) TaxID=544712 RepID=C6H1K1_AJECH|nr:conserved hypothetical protein [Histoplasma capsulatum H143]